MDKQTRRIPINFAKRLTVAKMIEEINNSWSWRGFSAKEIIQTNEFGNIIFKIEDEKYWRICPEELSCEVIAINEIDFLKRLKNLEFIEDWKFTRLVEIAKAELGELKEGEKFCLKLPAIIGGKYEKENFGKISFIELISSTGNLGLQIKDIKDGEEIALTIKY